MQRNYGQLSSAKKTLFIFFLPFLLLSGFSHAAAQTNDSDLNLSISDEAPIIKNDESAMTTSVEAPDESKVENARDARRILVEYHPDKSLFNPARIGNDIRPREKTVVKNFNDDAPNEAAMQSELEKKEKFHWKPALAQSGIFLGFQHAFRMTQHKTRRELGGKFFADWATSARRLRGWNDQDNLFTNYVAHPLQGGLTGRIFVNNSDRAARQEFGKSRKYWESRFKAMAWSAVWSTQFELGPISEASIGNVGIRDKRGGPTMTWGDLVVTPTLGTGVLVAEDAIDKYILKNWLERKFENKLMLKILRIVLTPTTSVGNLLRIKKPSWRPDRPL